MPTVLYVSGAWTLGKTVEKKLQGAEMKLLRNTQEYSVLDKESNLEVRQELKIETLYKKINIIYREND